MNSSPLGRFVWLIVAVAAMILLAPMAASAHEGHNARTNMVVHAAVRTSQVSHVAHLTAAFDQFAERAAAAVLVRSPDATSPDEESSCTAGCCFGMGCCGATIIAEGPVLEVPARPGVIALPGPERLASARLTSLLEPPNLLA